MELRQQKILAAIVKEYSETANPVGSKELVDKYRFQESSATIRSEMADLEKAGFIFQPHKSAGRVPTDKGYRFFVNQLMLRFELSEKERKMLREELLKLRAEHELLGRKLSHLLADTSGQAAFALMPHQASSAGLAHLVGEPELSDSKTTKAVAELFDHIEEHAGRLMKKSGSKVQTFIGGESPLPVPKNLSLMVSKVKMKGGKKGIIGIVGPKRMGYAKNQSLLEYLSKLISGAAVILFIVAR
ncbi:MAG: hypothetical protein A3E98_02780 [Candidatus Doudnabacteria bacterium RIFCSPHIGHO2_12_FULL_48_11]|uniref:Heat-inducible transcription repressor HrcA C-terminal domain-containing protein n=1 Tax=Candidatus Doudnabacteria bacterium RIFCSPHIGHO2_01_FULL_46_24 TaxID=1817825 RepID=A0A1F5NST2_9BACT|nr:MAG: hypothetical protein A2720_04170 [Candidatus Doudnabacteria bacterium RIFCSPHIGHO2_01_FULL_46_24]OGE94155.1 MAG: hypothetical protein A3E98_02780 [Candidatus Doudnabacteria bacterium RIFCSPHIGHO2_12_FULL_48_11]